MSHDLNARPPRPVSFPRVSGDEPLLIVLVLSVLGFSPRERG